MEWMQGKMHGFETHLKKKVEPFNFSFHSKYILNNILMFILFLLNKCNFDNEQIYDDS